MNVTEMAEKPSIQYAKDFLGVKNKSDSKDYYCTFGQYVLTPDVFEYLREDIEEHDKNSDRSEIQLTSALCRVLDEKGMTGVFVDGRSYDVGIPSAYAETVATFGKKENLVCQF